MIAFSPDLPVAPGPAMLPQTGLLTRDGGARLDFAGMVDAALPAELSALPGTPAEVAAPAPDPIAVPVPATSGLLPIGTMPMPIVPMPVPVLPPAPALAARLPNGGTILPENGAALPDAALANAVPPPALHSITPAVQDAGRSGADPAEAAPVETVPVDAVAVEADTREDTLPPLNVAPPTSSGDAAPVVVTVAAAPVLLAAALTIPAPVRAPPRPAALNAAPLSAAKNPAAMAMQGGDSSGTAGEPAPASLPAAVAPSTDLLAKLPEEAAPVSAPALPSATTTPLATMQPGGPPPAAPPPTAPPPGIDPRPPAPQIENAIAQVGELREAMRAARPELTLRHADFGLVSMRIEATGAQDWRAVLASRDPGFVPAIQAALAERTIAATADTASTGSNAGQNAPSDPRYGSSPGSGQASSQPYLGQSMTRDEGSAQHPHQRQQRSTATAAEHAGEPDADGAAPRNRGVFA